MVETKIFRNPITKSDMIGANRFVINSDESGNLTYYEGMLTRDGKWLVERSSHVHGGTKKLGKIQVVNFINEFLSSNELLERGNFVLYLKNDKEVEKYLKNELHGYSSKAPKKAFSELKNTYKNMF